MTMPSIETKTVQTPMCFECGKPGEVTVTAGAWERYVNGALVQNAFAELEAPLREQIVTGTHPDCWDKMMGEEPEDEAPCCIGFVTSGGDDRCHVPGCPDERPKK